MVLYILFTLLYSIENVKCKDPVGKQLKGALNAQAVNLSDGAAKMFLTNLYKDYFNETGRAKIQLQLFQKSFILCKGTGMIYDMLLFIQNISPFLIG